MRDYKTIWGIYSNTNIMCPINRILKFWFLRLICWIHDGIFRKGKRECFDHYAHKSYFCFRVLQYFSHLLSFSDIEFFIQVKVRDLIAFSHWLLHAFLEIGHLFSFKWGWRWGLRGFLGKTRLLWRGCKIGIDIRFEDTSIFTSSFYLCDIYILAFYEPTNKGSCENLSINIWRFWWGLWFFLWFFLLLHRRWSLLFGLLFSWFSTSFQLDF